jgi:hypothetical protein
MADRQSEHGITFWHHLIRQHACTAKSGLSKCILLDSVHAAMDSMESFRRSLKSSSILPVPSTTQDSGSSAIETGSPVFFADASMQVFQQRATAGEHDAAVADVSR